MNAAGNHIITRTFRSTLDQYRSLHFNKSTGIEEIAHVFDNLVTKHDIVTHGRPPQMKIAVFQQKRFVYINLFINIKWRGLRCIKDLNAAGNDFDFASRQFPVLSSLRPFGHLAGHLYHVFTA